MLRRIRNAVPSAAVLVAGAYFALTSCSANSPTSKERTASAESAITTTDIPYALAVPSDLTLNRVVLGASGTVTLGDRVKLVEPSGSGAVAANTVGDIVIGTDATLGRAEAVGSVTVGDRTSVTAIEAGRTIKLGNGDAIGSAKSGSVLVPPVTQAFVAHIPLNAAPAVTLQGGTRTLAPGRYAGLQLSAGATLSIPSGAYFFDSLDLEPQTTIQVTDANSQTVLYVRGSVILRGKIAAPVSSQLQIVYLGTNDVNVEMPFSGSIAAPFASLTLGNVPASYTGTFFAKNIHVGPGTTITHSPLLEQTCVLTTSGNTTTRHLAAVVVDSAGDELVFRSDHTLNFTETTFSATENGTVQLAGTQLFSYSVSDASGQPIQETLQWSPLVQGATNATLSVDGTTMTGSFDGRTLLPFQTTADPATAQFTDGAPGPRLHPVGPLAGVLSQRDLDQLNTAVAGALAACSAPPAAAAPTTVAGATTDFTPGHPSDTFGRAACVACKVAVAATTAVGAGVACFFSFGIACGAAVGGAVVADVAGIQACETGAQCCPVRCGDDEFACCFGDETCLAVSGPNAGLCCSPGKTPCGGNECCGSDESCLSQGPKKGSCCADTSTCGQDCCASGETCQNSTICCLPGKMCGSVCCGRASDLLELTCAAPDLCCLPTEVACGNTCCGLNHVCNANNQCVLAATIDCSDFENDTVCVDPTTGKALTPSPCDSLLNSRCDTTFGCCVPVPL